MSTLAMISSPSLLERPVGGPTRNRLLKMTRQFSTAVKKEPAILKQTKQLLSKHASGLKDTFHKLEKGNQILSTHTQVAQKAKMQIPSWRQELANLIEQADTLERTLMLSPIPPTPDVLVLLKTFQQIIRELDQHIRQLLTEQTRTQQLEEQMLQGYQDQSLKEHTYQAEKRKTIDRHATERLEWYLQERIKSVTDQSTLLLATLQSNEADKEETGREALKMIQEQFKIIQAFDPEQLDEQPISEPVSVSFGP